MSQDQQPNHNVLDVVFSRLEDRLDELTNHLRDLKANQQDQEVKQLPRRPIFSTRIA